MTSMQKNILTNLNKAMSPADMSGIVDSFPGPVGRSMHSLVDRGYAKLLTNGKFARTADGTKALKAAN
jgi:hypothetical protein